MDDDAGKIDDVIDTQQVTDTENDPILAAASEVPADEITDAHNVNPSISEVDIPSSHAIEIPTSHEIAASPKEKENPFNRFSESEHYDEMIATDCSIDKLGNDDHNDSIVPEEFPNIDDMDVSTPSTETVAAPADLNPEKASPMVVSVGTIEVNGANHYEDINIMSKGKSVEAKSSEEKSENSEENKTEDYESLRDLRFSSISMYDKPHFEEDITIIVNDAQKHAAESFVSYKVVTKTTRESFQQQEFHVRRRYQDFLWLSNILTQQYPSHIIPPLPQKKLFNRYDPNFLRLRQLALNKFLCRIAEHPILSTSEHFFAFLSAKQVELIEQKKSIALKRFNIPQIPVSDVETPFKSTSEYIEEFGKVLSSLSTHSTKLEKEQTEQIQALRTLPPSIALWANSEGDLEPILTKMGDSVSKTSDALEVLVETKEEIFTESIKEYQLYVNLVKNVLKNRDHTQVTKDYFALSASTKQKELEKVESTEPGKSFATLFGKSPEHVKEEKIEKLKKDIATLSGHGETAGDELVVANASIRSDIERWKINKEKDCRDLFTSVAAAHITCHKESAEVWQSLIEFIDSVEVYK